MTLPSFLGAPTGLPHASLPAITNILRQVLPVINRHNSGKMNVVLEVTLAASAAQTVVTDARLTRFSATTFDPMTANAAAELAAGTMYVADADRRNGVWTITHANNAQTDRAFRMMVFG